MDNQGGGVKQGWVQGSHIEKKRPTTTKKPNPTALKPAGEKGERKRGRKKNITA